MFVTPERCRPATVSAGTHAHWVSTHPLPELVQSYMVGRPCRAVAFGHADPGSEMYRGSGLWTSYILAAAVRVPVSVLTTLYKAS